MFDRNAIKPGNSLLNVYDSIKPLHYISKILQVWPYNSIKNKLTFSTPLKYSSLLTLGFLIFLFTFTTYGKIKFVQISSTSVITDIIFTLPLFSLVIYSTYIAHFNQNDLTILFFDEIDQVNELSGFLSEISYSTLKRNLIIKLIISISILLVMAAFDTYFYYAQVGDAVIYYMYQYFCYFPTIVIMLQIVCKTDILKENFKIVNSRLLNIFRNNPNGLKLEMMPTNVRNLCKIHIKLCDLLDAFNKIHGFQNAMLFCCILSLMLLSLNVGLWATNTKEFVMGNLQLIVVVYKFASVLLFFGPAVLVANSCSSAAEECFLTGKIAHNTLINIPVGTNNKFEILLQEELNLIIQQIGQRKSSFSAGGFFVIDFSIIYGLVGAVTSYFIVLLQFKV